MNPTKLFPLIVTNRLDATKAFYTQKAGCTVTIDMDQYLQVRFGDEPDGPELCFMTVQEAGSPMGRVERFEGRGLVVSVPTRDADATHAAMKARGAEPLSMPADKPWGWRSFAVADPNGVVLDFFHVIDQSAAADATG